jgi:hypothetical protein
VAELVTKVHKMKIGIIERIAVKSGPIGYWMTIVWASGLVGIGGLIIGVVLGDAVADLRNVEIEDDNVGISVVFGTAIVCAFVGGYFCRRHLIRIKKLLERNCSDD